MRFWGKEWAVKRLVVGIIGIVSALVGLAAAIVEKDTREISLVMLAISFTALLTILLIKHFQRIYVVYGARGAMRHLEDIARGAEYSVWTVRTHMGGGEEEQGYFNVISSRLADPRNSLQDIRRLVRLHPADSCHRHLFFLIDKFSDQPGVRVNYFTGPGPSFDFMVADRNVAAIGLPLAGAYGFAGTVFFRRSDVCLGIRDAFDELWQRSQTLFIGKVDLTEQERIALRERAMSAIESVREQPGQSIGPEGLEEGGACQTR